VSVSVRRTDLEADRVVLSLPDYEMASVQDLINGSLLPAVRHRLFTIVEQDLQTALAIEIQKNQPIDISDDIPEYRTTHQFIKNAGFSSTGGKYRVVLLFKKQLDIPDSCTTVERDTRLLKAQPIVSTELLAKARPQIKMEKTLIKKETQSRYMPPIKQETQNLYVPQMKQETPVSMVVQQSTVEAEEIEVFKGLSATSSVLIEAY
jgi:hypothetical protein